MIRRNHERVLVQGLRGLSDHADQPSTGPLGQVARPLLGGDHPAHRILLRHGQAHVLPLAGSPTGRMWACAHLRRVLLPGAGPGGGHGGRFQVRCPRRVHLRQPDGCSK